MARYNVDFDDIMRGDTSRITEQVAGDPDLSGKYCTITFKLSPALDDSDAHLQKTVLLGASSSTGEIDVLLLPADTQDLLPTTYYVDVQVAGSSIDVTTVRTGKIKVLADVTRNPYFIPTPTFDVLQTFTYTSFTVEAA